MDYTLWLLTAGYGLRSLQSKLPNYEAYFLHYMLAIILGKEMKTQFPESCIHHCWSNTQFFNVIFSPLGNTDPRHRKRRERGGASYQITKHVTKPARLLDSIFTRLCFLALGADTGSRRRGEMESVVLAFQSCQALLNIDILLSSVAYMIFRLSSHNLFVKS